MDRVSQGWTGLVRAGLAYSIVILYCCPLSESSAKPMPCTLLHATSGSFTTATPMGLDVGFLK